MRPILVMLLIALIAISTLSCGDQNIEVPENIEEDPMKKVVMVASEGGLGDKSFNDVAYEGILQGASDYQIQVSIEEPDAEHDYINAVKKAAEEADLVIAVGFIPKNKLEEIATLYPETLFAVLDSEDEVSDNVMNIAFKDHEGSFLVGVIAALTTESDIVGFIGGKQDPTMDKFEYGFRAGVKIINPNAQVLVDYTECYDNPAIGETIAKELIEEGADVLFHATGECGIGVIDAVAEMKVWAIGVDQDQSFLNHESVLCSMFKRADSGVYFAIQKMMEGQFKGGVYEFGLEFEAVGFVDGADNLPEEIKKQAEDYAEAIIAGKILVPKDRGGFEGFTVPEDDLI